MIHGKIFAIEEFSTYDGLGIRMTVFLKGCPLRCTWCHNPEGQRFETQIAQSPNGCLHCGACLQAGERECGVPCLTEASVYACPRKLIRICGEELDAETLCARLEKNLAILNASGGGVTFSGGEPLCQPDFLLACLKALRGKTNRALQTCGYASAELFARVIAECDYVLYDLKLMDEEQHRRFTGVSNRTIIENYEALAKSGVPFITRIPLIPTVNDTEENLHATAQLMQRCGATRIELLPYNKMAGGKYRMIGRTYEPGFDGSLPPQPHKEIFQSYGIEVNIL